MPAEEVSAIKLCRDCRYFSIFGRCQKQLKLVPDYVKGLPPERKDDWRGSPMLQREDGWFAMLLGGTCGKRARFFVPRKP